MPNDPLQPGLHDTRRQHRPALADQWRAINLFGRNVASYKFALAEAMLTLKPEADTLVRLENLAKPYALALCRHLKLEDKQATSASSTFLDNCRAFNNGELAEAKLLDVAVSKGFNNVIDAFHAVGGDDVPDRFYVDERREHGGIRVTEGFSRLLEGLGAADLAGEGEARWRLVETAWRLRIGSAMIATYDENSTALYLPNKSMRRVSVTSCRDALNGYQQGRCFYCSAPITIVPGNAQADVDHFFPHSLKRADLGAAVDGVWNLVLACWACNRGPSGKSARVPARHLLERLQARNEFLIGSHHPLRETLMQQTGATASTRQNYLAGFEREAMRHLIHRWQPRH